MRKVCFLKSGVRLARVKEFAQLRELMLLEDFKGCLPEQVVVYLNEQKVDSLAKAAVLVDEFALTHKSGFSPPPRRGPRVLPGVVGGTISPASTA